MARSDGTTDGTKTDMAPQTSGPGHRGPVPTFLLILVGYLYLCCLLGVWTSMSGLTGLALGLLAETVGLSWQGRSLRRTTFRRMEVSGLLLLLRVVGGITEAFVHDIGEIHEIAERVPVVPHVEVGSDG